VIYIGFSRGRSLRSKLIRWATAAEWSHVWVEYPSHVWGGRWVAHSAENGVVKVPAELYLASRETVKRFEVKPDITGGLEACREFVGKRYDYKVIWNALLGVLWRATGWEWLKKIVSKDSSKLTCSEFVTSILKEAGVVGTESMDPELTTPGDLESFCSSSDDFWAV
jgi:hypothetical protein